MSQSPVAQGAAAAEPYRAGWSAITRLLRRGYSWSGHERNVAFLNLGGGRFADVSAVAGFEQLDDGRALARVDWDGDGDQDAFLASRTGPRVRFLRNDTPSRGRHLTVGLEGPPGNPDGVGARVEVRFVGGARRVDAVRAGEGFLAQSSRWLSFALGDTAVEEVRVRWPGGPLERFAPPPDAVDGRWVLAQGSGRARSAPRTPASRLPASGPRAAATTGRARVVLAAPVPMPRLSVETADGRGAALFGPREGGTGRPLLLNLWGSFCAPCAAELGALAHSATRLSDAGLDVLALSVDEGEARADAVALLERVGWPFSQGFATREAVDRLDVLQGAVLDRETRLPLPTSWLVDALGRLVVVYFGELEPQVVLTDLALLDASPAERLAAATPLPGRWRDPEPPAADLARLERQFDRRGLPAAAREYHLGGVQVERLSEADFEHRVGQARIRQGELEIARGHLEQAVVLDPYVYEAWRDLGFVRHRLGALPEAVEAYREALRFEPGDARTRFNLGLALSEAGERALAWFELRRLAELEPELAERLRSALERADERR